MLSTLGRGPASQRDLADDQHVTEQTIGRTIAHLESTGHVARQSDPDGSPAAGRRNSPNRARALLAEMFETGERLTDDILIAADVDVPQFRRTLKTLIEAMDPAAVQPYLDARLTHRHSTGGVSTQRPERTVTSVRWSAPVRRPRVGC